MENSFSLIASNMNSLGAMPLDLQTSSTRSYNALGMSVQTHSFPVGSDFSLIILPFQGLPDCAHAIHEMCDCQYKVPLVISSSSEIDETMPDIMLIDQFSLLSGTWCFSVRSIQAHMCSAMLTVRSPSIFT